MSEEKLARLLSSAQLLMNRRPEKPWELPNEAETWIIDATEFIDDFMAYARKVLPK